MKNSNIDVFEHSTVSVASTREELYDENGRRIKISKDEFLALQKYHSKISSRFFILLHKKIKFKHYVGLIRVGNLNINILPKVDNLDVDEKKWHQVLTQMILFTKRFRHKRSTMSLLNKTNSSILDLYINEFYLEVEEVLRKGLRKSYSFKENNLTTVRGKILFNKDVVKNSTDKSKVYCRYQVYKNDNVLNYILFYAVNISLSMTNNKSLIDMGKSLLDLFPDINSHNLTDKLFESIIYNKNNSYYKNAINLAKLILQDTGLDLNKGDENVVSFLFDMNHLFEEFIYRMCKRSFGDDDFNVHRRGKRFWEQKLIKPDIVIENKKNRKTVVIDTKWKIPKDMKPSDADLKQIFIYNHYYSSPTSYLLYPSRDSSLGISIIPGRYKDYVLGAQKIQNSCSLGFIPINKNGELDIVGVQENLKSMINEGLSDAS